MCFYSPHSRFCYLQEVVWGMGVLIRLNFSVTQRGEKKTPYRLNPPERKLGIIHLR